MNVVTTTAITDNDQKTIAYVVPVKDYNRYKELEELEALENAELAKIAKQSLNSGLCSEEETDALFADILKAGKSN